MTVLRSIEEIESWQKENSQIGFGLPSVFRNSSLTINAKGCVFRFGANAKLINCHVAMDADEATVAIGSDSVVQFGMRVGNKASIIIGDRFWSTGGGLVSASEGTTLKIGDDCLFAIQMDLRSDHAHPIFDRETGERLNPSRDVTIGDHVWLGPYVRVYPGAVIGEGCVIGSGSLVNAEIPPNSLAVGVPAKVVRKNVVWHRAHMSMRKPWKFDHFSAIEDQWNSRLPLEIEPEPELQKTECFHRIGLWLQNSGGIWLRGGLAGLLGAAFFEALQVFL